MSLSLDSSRLGVLDLEGGVGRLESRWITELLGVDDEDVDTAGEVCGLGAGRC